MKEFNNREFAFFLVLVAIASICLGISSGHTGYYFALSFVMWALALMQGRVRL